MADTIAFRLNTYAQIGPDGTKLNGGFWEVTTPDLMMSLIQVHQVHQAGEQHPCFLVVGTTG